MSQSDEDIVKVPLSVRELEILTKTLRTAAREMEATGATVDDKYGAFREAADARERLAEELDQVIKDHFA